MADKKLSECKGLGNAYINAPIGTEEKISEQLMTCRRLSEPYAIVKGYETQKPKLKRRDLMTEKEACDECANISLRGMYLRLLKTQELVLDINPQYNKKEILYHLVRIERDILMLNDENNCVDRDLFR